jgi:sterol desaturase/sphingolipid hydroxylase (fatty acid hydroxylase superfamily)
MPIFYARIHKHHHKFKSTIGIAAEFASPIESIFANFVPTLAGPLLLGSHPYTYWIYLWLRVWETVESHSGYEFPWSPWNLFEWQG